MSRRLFSIQILITLSFFANICLASAKLDFSPKHFASNEAGQLFTIKGSNTVGAHLAPMWVKNYLEQKGLSSVEIKPKMVKNEVRVEGYNSNNKLIYIDIDAHGSSTGFGGLIDNSADIAMSSRPIKKAEENILHKEGNMRSFDAEHVVALDGLAIIVHPSNSVRELTIDEIAKIFSGEISNWSEFGGPHREINTYARDKNSGTWDTFKSLVLRKEYKLNPNAKRFESNDELSDLVSKDIGGVGFVGLASIRNSKAVSISSGYTLPLPPTVLGVATEDYPLSRRLFMYTKPFQTNPFVNEFVEFIDSRQGQELVHTAGFVSQNPICIKTSEDIEGPEEYLAIVKHAERLSINFRFNEGSAVLDNKAQQDILRVARFMKGHEGKQIQLIGFGDLNQSSRRAVILSKLRAVAVKSALRQYDVSTASVTGFGSYMPVSENTGKDKFKNQRVEIWVYDDAQQLAVEMAKKKAAEKWRQDKSTDFASTTL